MGFFYAGIYEVTHGNSQIHNTLYLIKFRKFIRNGPLFSMNSIVSYVLMR